MELWGRRTIAAVAGVLVAVAGLVAAYTGTAQAAIACDVTYTSNTWTEGPGQGGFGANITIKNLGSPISGWTLRFSFSAGQTLTGGWQAVWSQSGAQVTAVNESYNANIATGGSVGIGFNGRWTGSNPNPTSFSVNGVTCTGAPASPSPSASASPSGGTGSITVNPTSVSVPEGGTATVSVSVVATGSRTVTLTRTGDADVTVSPTSVALSGSGTFTATVRAAEDADQANGTATITISSTGLTPASFSATESDNDGDVHVANPYQGARGYINRDYADQVLAAGTAQGGDLGEQMKRVASSPTALWLDSLASIDSVRGGKSLRAHMDAALVQSLSQGNMDPVVVTLVLSDLPDKDCVGLIYQGDLEVAGGGLNLYKTQFIDRIAAIVGDPKYAKLRIAVVVEPNTLMELVFGTSQNPRCAEANQSGVFVQGIQYALNKLHPIFNVYPYLDIAKSVSGGYDQNAVPFVTLVGQVVGGTNAGRNSVDGFVSNVADYVPVEEIYLPNPNLTIQGSPLIQSRFYEFNKTFDELDYVTNMRTALIQNGFPTSIGMLIDTSRNGWGGPARPTSVSMSTDLNTYVDESRLDRRLNRGNWCNQENAGIGSRPQASPSPNIDAYVWVKVPGESDGVSTAAGDRDDPNMRFNRWCDPDFTPATGALRHTGAAPGAPPYGQFFTAYFKVLVQNAFPPL